MSAPSRQTKLTLVLNSHLLLPAILLLAASLRVIYIGHHSFWVDELFSLKFASYSIPDLFREVASFDNHPPTYYLLLHFWIQLFGDSELSLRIPSAIFSVLSVYFTFKVGELLFDRQVALIAALLLALSGFSIYYAQEARMYGLLAFSSVLSVYFMLKLQDKQTTATLFNYIWSTTLLAYTHLYGIFIILAENVYILANLYRFANGPQGMTLRKWMIAQVAIAVLSIPWFGVLVNRILSISQEGFWATVPTSGTLVKTFATFSGTSGGLTVWILLMIIGILPMFIATERAGRALLYVSPAPGERKSIFLLALLVASPVFLPYVISQFTTPVFIIRSTIAGQFAFFLLVANGIMHIPWRYLRYAALLLVLLISFRALIISDYVHHNATQFREAVKYLAEQVTDSDVLILCSHKHMDWPLMHYLGRKKVSAQIVKTGSGNNLPDHLNGGYLWLIRRTDLAEQCERLPPVVTDQYLPIEDASAAFRNIEVRVFKRK